MQFINFSEMAGFSAEGFAKVDLTKSTSGTTTTTTVYGGKPSLTDPSASTDSAEVWDIRRTVIVENDSGTTITTTWAKGSWTNRANLTYKYL